MKKRTSIYTALRMPEDLRAAAIKRAKQQGRSLSNYLKQLVRADLGWTEEHRVKPKEELDPELAHKLAEIAAEESTTVKQIVERFVKEGIACRIEARQMADQFRQPKKEGRPKRARATL